MRANIAADGKECYVSLGRTLATPAALRGSGGGGAPDGKTSPARYHVAIGARLYSEDVGLNEEALRDRRSLMLVYTLPTGEVVWIITEADRSATTLLLPADY